MAEITASMVKELRDKTGVGMMECKKALQEAEGDLERAGTILRERGAIKALKRAERAASEGLIKAASSADKRKAALVEVNIETDFAARSDRFIKMTDIVVQTALERGAENLDALLAAAPVGNPEAGSVQQLVTNAIGVIGENMAVRRNAFFAVPEGKAGMVGTYIHHNGKVGVMVQMDCGSDAAAQSDTTAELAKNLCHQIAFSAPLAIDSASLSPEVVAKEREIYRNTAINEGKPEKILDKIVEGKLKSYFKDVCLLEQGFFKEEDKSIGALVIEAAKATGSEIKVARFIRFQLGEENAKQTEN